MIFTEAADYYDQAKKENDRGSADAEFRWEVYGDLLFEPEENKITVGLRVSAGGNKGATSGKVNAIGMKNVSTKVYSGLSTFLTRKNKDFKLLLPQEEFTRLFSKLLTAFVEKYKNKTYEMSKKENDFRFYLIRSKKDKNLFVVPFNSGIAAEAYQQTDVLRIMEPKEKEGNGFVRDIKDAAASIKGQATRSNKEVY